MISEIKKPTTAQGSAARTIKKYVAASNKHDVKSIVACFADAAVVHDEGKKLRGKKTIESWVVKTIKKYKFQFKLLGVKSDDAKAVAEIEVSGIFDGSPVTLDYHFVIENGKFLSLAVK